MTRQRKLSRDAKGYFRPRIGWVAEGNTRKQPRFNLGVDERLARTRYASIQALYDGLGGDWTEEAISIAKAIAKGETPLIPAPESKYADPLKYRLLVDRLKEQIGDALPANTELYERAVPYSRAMIQYELATLQERMERLGALLVAQQQIPETLLPGSLHLSLDQYRAAVLADGGANPSANILGRCDTIDRIKAASDELPMGMLDYTECQKLINHWRNRPVTKKGTPAAISTCKHHIDELIAFFSWLEKTIPGWNVPKGLNRKIKRLESDRKTAVVSKDVYSIDELKVLASYATEREKLSLICGLNIAGGAAELGRIKISDVLINHKHEYADRLSFTSTASDSFIRMYRPKTDVFGEWLLWPETVELLKRGIERAKAEGTDIIWCRAGGNPLYSLTAKNAQAGFANMWGKLISRVRKDHEDFRSLPFGSLRDTLPDMLRHKYSGELASLCLAHGSPHADNLLECYANRPYGALHAAIRELREVFLPVLTI